MINKSKQSPQPRQAGVALLEVLVSLIVIAVGLLGLAQLQTASLKNNQAAYQRSQATLLAADIIERIRSNEGGALASNDLTEWMATIESTLPTSPDGTKAKGEIKPYSLGGTDTKVVEISWYSVDKATVTFKTKFHP